MSYTNVVFVRHGNTKPFLFETVSWPELKKGDSVICDTKHAKDEPGVCITDSISLDADELEAVATGVGATLPLKRIRGVVTIRPFEYKDESPAGADDTGEAMDG